MNDSIITGAAKDYLKAIELRDSDKLKEAEKLFQKVRKIFKRYNYFEKYSECLNKLGIVYIHMGKFPKALQCLRTGLKISEKHKLEKNKANIIGNIGLIKYYRGLYKEAMELFQEELKIFKKVKDITGVKIATGKIANSYIEVNDYDKAIHYFKVQEKLCEKTKDRQTLLYTFGGLAQAYIQMYNFEKVFYYLNKQILLCEEISDRRGLSIALCTTGFAYFLKQDYDHSLSYFYRALDNDKKLNNIRGLVYTYSSLGNIYKDKKDHASALKYFKKQLALSIKLKMHRQEASSLGDIGIIYKVRKQFGSALKFFRKQTGICRKYKQTLSLFFALDNLGEIFRLTGKYELSLKYFHEQLALSKKAYGNSHPNTSMAFRNIGKVFTSTYDFKKALAYYQKSLIAISKNFESHSIKNNPSMEEAYSEKQLFETLHEKAHALRKLYSRENSSEGILELSLVTYELALRVADKTRASLREESSKFFITENLVPVYEEAIDTAVELFNITGDEKYFDKAFGFAEKNKAVTLLENIKESEAKIISNLPQNLIEKEKSLNANIAFQESEKHKELLKGRKSDKKSINKFEESIFNLKRQYNSFREDLEKNHPEYRNLKTEITGISIKDVRKKLITENNMIIEYFAGEKAIYTFKITDKNVTVTKTLRNKNFGKSIKDLREALVTFSLLNFSDNLKKFSDNAYKLYLILLDKVLNEGEIKSSLIIIPDSIIGYIPFEALITEPGLKNSGYKNHSYLIKNFNVSYGYSSVYLLKNAGEQKYLNQKKIIGFAPGFENPSVRVPDSINAEDKIRSQLVPLNFNEAELKEIGKYFPGDYFINKDATKKTFLENADKYTIIHLATHCLIDEKNPMFSRICFSKSHIGSDDYLYSYELFNLKLNSRLAVLSACQTGMGKLIKGEGILSIARGFAFSNCTGIVMSLWQVNDQSTSKIMSDFYRELFHGNRIDNSLRAAKLRYLENSNQFNSSPFFWAPFIVTGNCDPIKFHTPSKNK